MWQKIKNFYHLAQALTAAVIYNFPSNKLTVIAVTGTDGKTTTVNMIFDVLSKLGEKTAMISSLGAQIVNDKIDTGFHVSTPNAFDIQKLLKMAVKTGCRYFIIEATSHGLDQNRLAYTKIDTAVLTNITKEHMDYHKNWQNYATAKLTLFKSANKCIVNADDHKSFQFMKTKLKNYKTYSQKKKTDYNLKNTPLKLQAYGKYNLSNALAAAAALAENGFQKKEIVKRLNSFTLPDGRLEEIKEKQNYRVFVDFAHTPNAITECLSTLSRLKKGKSRLIAVFGSAGERDKEKRPEMGAAAAHFADIIILTSEDPRSEDPREISKAIEIGVAGSGKILDVDYFFVDDRKEAIKFAINMAKNNDILAFLGKGHEKSMNIKGVEVPWDEKEQVSRQIQNRLKNEK